MTEQPVRDTSNRRSVSPGRAIVVAILVAIPFVALCWVGSYAKVDPKLGGFPFFFWYQLLWVLITATLTFIAYRILESGRRHRSGGSADASAASAESGEENAR
jgi:hypothetical protein